MFIRLLTVFMLLIPLTGCSTMMNSRAPSAINQLRIKVARLEKKLKESNEEVAVLQQKVRSMEDASLVQGSTYDSVESDYTFTDEEIEPLTATSDSAKAAYDKYDTKSYIRVSASVEDIQKALKNAGYYAGPIDGKFGSGSKSAVYTFQQDHNLTSDGIIGRQTWAELQNYLE